MNSRAVLTIATTDVRYLRLAENLARSFKLWNGDSGLRFIIATDLSEPLSSDLNWVEVRRFEFGSIGMGYVSKLNLDWIADEGETLFIDADCLIFKPIMPVFEAFAGCDVSAYGSPIDKGEWFGDVRAYLNELGLRRAWQFNSGIYYLRKGDMATSVFKCARELAGRYDKLGLQRLHGKCADEVIMSLAMSLHDLNCLHNDNNWIMAEFQGRHFAIELDILKGVARLRRKILGLPQDYNGPQFRTVEPSIVHFMGGTHLTWQYSYNADFLRLALKGPLERRVASGLALVVRKIPGQLRDFLSDAMVCSCRVRSRKN